ncbi:unnamed protein product [Tuber melanosporum]|uniref:(Perigord truffle) hypothetical protein n=1 Tax=Tuber melanosporum (strain Mel28) TaxID=656061 RepID=D5G7R4_TUBMM|nr:uncharacterized protein GSTUM_00004689001 [Tuber melanosporum]CAZ80557.1 unnamed protein product [Tuber melanosporum]
MTDRLASFVTRLCLSSEVIAGRGASIVRQRCVVHSIWPRASCYPVGSFQTRTSLKNSDVDLLVSIPGQSDEHKCMVEAATRMREAIIGRRIAEPRNCTVIGGAKVPILTYTDEKVTPPLKFDISFQKENAVRNTAYLVQTFDERPFMRDLVILMKYWLRERRLNEVYKGGLGSYAVSLTVIGFFNVNRRTLIPRDYQALITGSRHDMFVEYLKFWTRWKYNEDILVPDPGIIQKMAPGKRKRLPFMLRMVDPTDPDNDVGKAAYKIPKVITAMKKLRHGMENLGPDTGVSELDKLLSGTLGEKERYLKEKFHQDRNDRKMFRQMQKRIEEVERKAVKSGREGKSVKKSLARMRASRDEFARRRPALAAEFARPEPLPEDTGAPVHDPPGPGYDFDLDTLMIGPVEKEVSRWIPKEPTEAKSQNDETLTPIMSGGKSPEQLQLERAKHIATIEAKRVRREKTLQKRHEKLLKKKEKKAQKKIAAEKKLLEGEEELAKRPKASKVAAEKEAGN